MYYMKKDIKIIIVLTIFLLLTVVFYSVIKFREANNININTENMDLLSEEEKNSLNLYHLGVYEAISRDESGRVKEYRAVKLKEEEPIQIELMSNVEKQNMGISIDNKVQVLQRDKDGNVIIYRIIKNDSDILTKY